MNRLFRRNLAQITEPLAQVDTTPDIKSLSLYAQADAIVMSPTGDILPFKRDKQGALKMQTAGAWAPTGGGAHVREVSSSDSGRARAYSASVWAFACVNLRASKVADLMNATQLVNKKSDEVVTDHPYLDAIKDAYTRFQQDVYWEYKANELIFGEVYIEKMPLMLPTPYGNLDLGTGGVRVLPSAAIEPRIELGRIVGYDLIDDAGQAVFFELDDVAYRKTYNPSDTTRGKAPMDAVLDAVNVDMYVLRYSKQYYANGARPGLVFTPKELDLNEADMDNIRTEIKTQLKGVDNFFRPIFLNYAMEATLYPQQSLEDQGYLTAEERERIAAAFNVPVGMVTFADSRYQFSPEQRESFYEEVVVPDMNSEIRFFNAHVLPDFDEKGEVELRANPADITALIGQLQRKAEVANMLFDRGSITHNERRVMLKMRPDKDGDFYSLPAGRVYIDRDDLKTLVGGMTQPNVMGSTSQRPGQPSFYYGGGRDRANPPAPTNAPPNTNINKSITSAPQEDVLDELRAWEKKARRQGAQKAVEFECYHVSDLLAEAIRNKLRQDDLSIFARAKASFGSASGTVILHVRQRESILGIQQFLQRELPSDAPVRWVPMEDLHITLVHSALVDEQAFGEIAGEVDFQATFDIYSHQLTTFAADGAIPIILLVERDDNLLRLQQGIYEAFDARGVITSEYSVPSQWKPHITLGYIEAGYAENQSSFDLPVEVTAQADWISFTRTSYTTEHGIAPHYDPFVTFMGKAIQATRLDFEIGRASCRERV